uniref:Uncharacterized protein n=1 Tax=Angiostrongylus cantonensis TaxID=6313 RepID=A0A0K0CWQ0_ANGCA
MGVGGASATRSRVRFSAAARCDYDEALSSGSPSFLCPQRHRFRTPPEIMTASLRIIESNEMEKDRQSILAI